MTDEIPNIVPAIGGLVGIGIMAGAANAVIKQTQGMSGKKKGKKIIKTQNTSFASGMDERIKRII